MLKKIGDFTKEFLEQAEKKPVRLVSHYDTDGITSAAIIIKTLKRLNKRFSVRIVKGIEEHIIEEELKNADRRLILFTDLASGSLERLSKTNSPVFIIDHHEINREKIPENIRILNPHLEENENVCSAGLCYLFSREISPKNKDLSKVAIIGMIGDRHEREISRIYQDILEDAEELELKKSLLIFSATRPLRRSLEYSTSTYIPGVTGSSEGVLTLLRDNGISPDRTLYELNEQELSKLITSIALKRGIDEGVEDLLGNVYILKFFNRKEDGREISTLINACSRLGYSDLAIAFCLETTGFYEKAQDIYIKYRKEILEGIKTSESLDKIEGSGFVIMNAREQIKDAIIGTVCSMLSSSKVYEQGTILIGMAYNQDKIKISARVSGKTNRNLKEVLEKTVLNFEAEVGGHQYAAGCLIKKEDENRFIESLKKNLEVEIIKL